MKTKSYLRKIWGVVLGAALVSGAVMLAGTPASAQSRHGRRVIVVRPSYSPFWGYRRFGYPYDYYGPYSYYNQYVFSSGQSAFNQGYHDGMKTGKDDGKKNKSYNPERSHYFQEAGFGNFAEAYREGFSQGYRAGFGEYRG
ncbi:MAG TPA: hypothetical protein VFA21_02240 [Pyrinomonadaceae bacterium]|jgi:hypothetical protein|nr:hypothetical protein [Pyrinomonadaceae bacterium]